jgi:hypothetical protein
MVERANVDLYSVCDDLIETTQILYGVSFWLLQERACFTYKEAAFYLAMYRGETKENLIDRFKVSKKQIKRIRRSAEKKLERYGGLDEVLMGYIPRIGEYEPPNANICCEMRKKGMRIFALDGGPLF